MNTRQRIEEAKKIADPTMRIAALNVITMELTARAARYAKVSMFISVAAAVVATIVSVIRMST